MTLAACRVRRHAAELASLSQRRAETVASGAFPRFAPDDTAASSGIPGWWPSHDLSLPAKIDNELHHLRALSARTVSAQIDVSSFVLYAAKFLFKLYAAKFHSGKLGERGSSMDVELE